MNKNYIDAEQFLEQPKELQKLLRNWWKPQIGDLFCDIDAYDIKHIGCILTEDKLEVIEIDNRYNYYIPLYNETQLRCFIEEKSGRIELISITGHDYSIVTFLKSYGVDYAYDLLQAYWQVACEIAEKQIALKL